MAGRQAAAAQKGKDSRSGETFSKRFTAFGRAVALGLTLLSAVPLATSPAQAAPLDTVRERGNLAVIVYRDFPPFSQQKGGKVVGIDVDIAQEIGKRLGVAVEILQLTADESVDDDLRNGVWKGTVVGGRVGDVMMHVPYDRQLDIRNDMAVLFGPYYQETLAVARPRQTLTVAELSDERTAVELDSISDLYLSGVFGGSIRDSLHRFLTYAEAVKAYQDGEVSALMGTRSELQAAVKGLDHPPVVSVPGLPGLTMRSWPLGVAVKMDSRDLGYAVADALQAMMDDGTLEGIFQTYGVTYQKPN
jgi:ABC-type amino acid transport substrate-binding protein